MPNLILIPTLPELAVLRPRLESLATDARWRIELCGFGIAAAAARTAMLVERHRPDRVILTGIAGSFDDSLPIGEAFEFDRVACFGIGAGSGKAFQTAGELGWSHWQSTTDSTGSETRRTDIATGDVIEIDEHAEAGERLLLTACSASASARDVQERLRKFPAAMAEDMEGFGVAIACRLADTPLQIIRGISNRAGDRNKARWKVAKALESAAQVTVQNARID